MNITYFFCFISNAIDMKKKLFPAVITVIGLVYILCNIYQQSNKEIISDICLMNIEALANGESVEGEKKYKYQVWQNEECLIYVGGAYAKGKKVSCYSGSDHPVCVDCSL